MPAQAAVEFLVLKAALRETQICQMGNLSGSHKDMGIRPCGPRVPPPRDPRVPPVDILAKIGRVGIGKPAPVTVWGSGGSDGSDQIMVESTRVVPLTEQFSVIVLSNSPAPFF